MSSSTSISKPPERPAGYDRRRLWLLAGLFLVVLGGVAGVNAYVDPYGRFRTTAVAQQHLGFHVNFALLSLMQVAKVPASQRARADVVILGDSRADQLTTERLSQYQGHTLLNLGCGGASLEESLSMLEHEWPRLKKVRYILITTPFERLSEHRQVNHAVEAAVFSDSLPRYLLSYEMLKISCTALTRPASVNRPQGDHDTIIRTAWRALFKEYDAPRAEARLKLLQRWAERARSRGAHLVLWAPPVDAATQRILRDEGFDETWGQLAGRLGEIAPLVDLTHAPGLGGVPFHFRDPVHTSDSGPILSALLAK